MDPTAQIITNAERENHRGRPKDALSLVCAVLVAQHHAIQELHTKVANLESSMEKLREPW